MGRTMPTECPHGKILDWGDFGPDGDGPNQPEQCDLCAKARQDRILWNAGGNDVDEIVCHGVTIHVEQMSDTCHWMGVYSADGKQDLMVNFVVRKGKLHCYVEDAGEVSWNWGRDEEHEPWPDDEPYPGEFLCYACGRRGTRGFIDAHNAPGLGRPPLPEVPENKVLSVCANDYACYRRQR